MSPRVSIIMPAYNAAAYIGEAVRSVIAQTCPDWELIIVNDGSTDATAEVIARFTDARIIALEKRNGGIGSARNMALDVVRGGLLCFLDADDVLPPCSLEARIAEFDRDPRLDIVDGRVRVMDARLERELRIYMPQHTEDAFHELVTFSGRCFMGPSWMLRWGPGLKLRFEEGITHAEDLFFFMRYAREGRLAHYGFTTEDILLYRRTGHSSMATNLDGMERSMQWIGRQLAERAMATLPERITYSLKRRRMMAGSFRRAGRPWKALGALLR